MDCNNCPDLGILVEIDAANCPFDLKQIQKMAFSSKGSVIWDSATGGGLGDGSPQVDSQIDTKADWDARRAAVDASKMVVTPFIGGDPIITAGEPITEGGGDNSTLNGVEEVVGTNPSVFSAVFKSLSVAQELAIKDLMCRSGVEVTLFLEGGKIAASKPSATSENITGFTTQSLFLGDRNNEGFGTKDSFAFSFSLAAGWSETLVVIDPADFNPLFDL